MFRRVQRNSASKPTSEGASRFAPRPFASRSEKATFASTGPDVILCARKKHSPKPAPKYPSKWSETETENLAHLTGLQPQETEEERLDRVNDSLLALTPFSGIAYNCYAWALGLPYFIDPGNTLASWKYDDDTKGYDFLPPGSPESKILLWGQRSGPQDTDVIIRHASVLLTHSELMERKNKDFVSLDISDESIEQIEDDPFWSSAMGFSIGVAVHPKDFFAGGAFGEIVAGMKPS